MKLYYRDANDNLMPVEIDTVLLKDMANKLVVFRLGSKDHPVSPAELQEFYEDLDRDEVMASLWNNTDSKLLVVNSAIEIQLLSMQDLKKNKLCVLVDGDTDLSKEAEIKANLKEVVGKDPVVVPTAITFEEYIEVKDTKARIQIRKQRRGGGLNENSKG